MSLHPAAAPLDSLEGRGQREGRYVSLSQLLYSLFLYRRSGGQEQDNLLPDVNLMLSQQQEGHVNSTTTYQQ